MTDLEGRLRAAMHAAVDGEEAPDDLAGQVRRRHRRHVIRTAGAAVIAIAMIMIVPAVLAARGSSGSPATGTSSGQAHPSATGSPAAKSSPPPAHSARPRPGGHRPSRLTGLHLPADRGRLLLASARPAWFTPATRETQVIANLPPEKGGYSLTPADGGWAASAISTGPGCPSWCAGPAVPVYFIADGALAATRVGTGYAVSAANGPGRLWLMRYRRASANPGTSSATAQEVTTDGRLAGPPRKLPAGYLIQRAVGASLLLAQASQGPDSVYELWDPAIRRVVRTFPDVIAASASQIAWEQQCENCAVHVLDLSTGTNATIQVPRGSWAYDGTFSADGRLLAIHLSADVTAAGQARRARIAVIDIRARRVAAVPGSTVSVDIPAVLGIGWQADGHRLVVTLSGSGETIQVGYWRPGAAHLLVATFQVPRGMSPAVEAYG